MEVLEFVDGIKKIIARGGPNISEYEYLKNIPQGMVELPLEKQEKVFNVLTSLLTVDSMIGFTFQKPHGYAGDFELIDRIYSKRVSDNKSLEKWDLFYHDLEAATAVRNRKKYFKDLVDSARSKHGNPLVLNLGSGPCSDLYEYFQKSPNSSVRFDCLDMDEAAIEYGSAVCDNFVNNITFIQKNAFRFKPNYQYELIWSAGLFDYFNDKLFVRLLNRMYALVKSGGELVIGNFSDNNPSKDVMEVFGQWFLHHRSEEKLVNLALKAGVSRELINVSQEEAGVNLFLHLRRD